MIEKIMNSIWLQFNKKRYKKFVELVKSKGYDEKQIWFNHKLGFICMPD